jgi:hypothetical protein
VPRMLRSLIAVPSGRSTPSSVLGTLSRRSYVGVTRNRAGLFRYVP